MQKHVTVERGGGAECVTHGRGFSAEATEGLYKLVEASIRFLEALFGLVLYPNTSASQGEVLSSYDERGEHKISTIPFLEAVLRTLCAFGNLLDLRLVYDAAQPFIGLLRRGHVVSVEVHGIEFLRLLPGALRFYSNATVGRLLGAVASSRTC